MDLGANGCNSERDHPMTISPKSGLKRPYSFKEEHFFKNFQIGSHVTSMSADGGHLGRRSSDIILKAFHLRSTPTKSGHYAVSG